MGASGHSEKAAVVTRWDSWSRGPVVYTLLLKEGLLDLHCQGNWECGFRGGALLNDLRAPTVAVNDGSELGLPNWAGSPPVSKILRGSSLARKAKSKFEFFVFLFQLKNINYILKWWDTEKAEEKLPPLTPIIPTPAQWQAGSLLQPFPCLFLHNCNQTVYHNWGMISAVNILR